MHGRLGDWVAEIRRAPRRYADDAVRGGDAGPGRTHHRAAQGIRRLCRSGRSRRGRAVRGGARRHRRLSRGFRLPDAGLQIYAEADVFEEERRAPERRRSATKAFLSDLRDLKVGDLVVHVDHGIGMFVGLKQIGVGDAAAGVSRAALRRRRQAVRPGRAPRPRPEIHRRLAAADRSPRRRVVGAREDPRQEGRCATWRRSCSSSTPRARRCRAMRSAPIRTGSRSSRTRSNTS